MNSLQIYKHLDFKHDLLMSLLLNKTIDKKEEK